MKKIVMMIVAIVSQLPSSEISWSSPPSTLSTSSVNAASPQIAMDANGNAAAVWIENGQLKAKSKLIGGAWSAISTLSAATASSPCLVLDQNGDATVIWIENAVATSSSKTLSGTWVQAQSLSSTGATIPSLAVDSSGNVIAVWVRSGNLETSTKLFGARWQAVSTIRGTSPGAPHIALGGSGTGEIAVLVWHDMAGTTNAVYAAQKSLSGNWSTPQSLGNSRTNNAYARVAVDSQGNTVAAWYSYEVIGSDYFNVVVHSACEPAAGSWGSPVALSEAGVINPSTLSLHVGYDALGNAMALWSTSLDGDTFVVQSATKPVHEAWTSSSNITQGTLYSYTADLTLLPTGNTLAAVMFYNGTAHLIQSLESDIAGFVEPNWSLPITISTDASSANPKTAAALTGNVINTAAVWLFANGTINSVAAATGSRSLLLPPTLPSVSQKLNQFGVFSEYYNTLSWHASPDPQAVGYIIFRNGVYLTQVGVNTLDFIDNNRVENGAVTYGVAAINSDSAHSRIITVSLP